MLYIEGRSFSSFPWQCIGDLLIMMTTASIIKPFLFGRQKFRLRRLIQSRVKIGYAFGLYKHFIEVFIDNLSMKKFKKP